MITEEDTLLDCDDDEEQTPDINTTNDVCQRIYLKACILFKVTPSTFLYRHLTTVKVPLQNHAIGDIGAKAMATALVVNKVVQVVDLSSIGISIDGLEYILEMLEENVSITDINLSNNFFNSKGAKLISSVFINNQTIKKLNISGNGFKDEDSRFLAEIIEENNTIQELIISRNSFGESAGENFGKALEHNRTLIHFDISWNHLRQQGAIELCHGLQNNNTLEVLRLSWNGFGLEGCHEMGKTLKVNRTLTELDLSSNRVNFDAFKLLLRGLVKNKILKTLKIGFNPITTDGAMSILRAVLDDRCKSLTTLDMSDVSVDNDFVTLLKKVQHIRPLYVTHGNLLRHDDLRKGDNPVVLDTDDPVTILFECVKTKNLRLIDLMKNLDKDNSDTLSREELNRGLSEIDVPLSRRSLDILMEKLDINKDGQVDFMELMTKYKEHVRRVTKLQREADVDLKHYKHFDKLEQLREMVRLRLSLTPNTGH
ncbi:leucine-rich repeat-containing protein 74B-like [Ruditapes philippinarum]|uniref:leucine-rich repeat-containing protein 74B-like n=1 Tax=Ruditapes philippinarum TaxID=129788 RepID=UPI00295C102A|nr:leucine-rich repeat-containing protein 74B-like [Ruditapes philippinarum]